jgi:isoamylase
VFRRRRFFQGRRIRGAGVKDVTWFEPSGQEMTDRVWNSHFVRALMVCLEGDAIDEMDLDGNRIVGDTFLLLWNAHEGAIWFTLPAHPAEAPWERVLDTGEARLGGWGRTVTSLGDRYRLRGRSIAVLRARRGNSAQGDEYVG